MTISYEFTNHGPDTLTFDFGFLQQFGFVVETPDSEIIYSPYHLGPADTGFQLLPGESRSYSERFSCVPGGNTYWPPGLERLPVGTHEVRAGLIVYKDEYPWSEGVFRVTK